MTMTTTGEEIKKQEFQIKFRGYAPSEVRDYLELLADEFSGLVEKIQVQEQKLSKLSKVVEAAEDSKRRLAGEHGVFRKTIESINAELKQRVVKEAQLMQDFEKKQKTITDFDRERRELQDELKTIRQSGIKAAEKLQQHMVENEQLQSIIEKLESQNRELKQEEVDFKQAMAEARNFSDSLIEQTRKETALALQQADAEIERLRLNADNGLGRLQDDLNRLLNEFMDGADELSPLAEDEKDNEYDDLFQKIDLPEFAEIEQYQEPDERVEESEEDLRNKLEDGGVAYLSDT